MLQDRETERDTEKERDTERKRERDRECTRVKEGEYTERKVETEKERNRGSRIEVVDHVSLSSTPVHFMTRGKLHPVQSNVRSTVHRHTHLLPTTSPRLNVRLGKD